MSSSATAEGRLTRALVIRPELESVDARETDNALAEAKALAEAIDLVVMQVLAARVAKPRPSHLFGKGKVEELAGLVEQYKIGLVVVDSSLSPVQQRNLERDLVCKVIDRTGLILEIFGARARTREGQLQVELAALNYQKSRLVKSWTHLERQRGGFGFLGGPGETQLEIDKRLIAARIKKIQGELADVRAARGMQRKQRQRQELPTVALVGYTNAGKSTLFNRLTSASVLAKDMLFATLDPTLRGLELPSGRKIMLSDTVGFIADLPTQLIEAFRATLEEVIEADLILHVRDISSSETAAQRDDVLNVLAEIGVAETDERLAEVLNKVDVLPKAERDKLQNYTHRMNKETVGAVKFGESAGHGAGQVAISALQGQGIDDLLKLMDDFFARDESEMDITLPHAAGKAVAWLYQHAHVLQRKDGAAKVKLRVRITPGHLAKFERMFLS